MKFVEMDASQFEDAVEPTALRGWHMKMRAVDAAVRILEAEGITCAFGVPGPAINPPPQIAK